MARRYAEMRIDTKSRSSDPSGGSTGRRTVNARIYPFLALLVVVVAIVAPAVSARHSPATHTPTLLAGGLAGGLGSTVGPGHKLYVAEPVAGRIARVDTDTGAVTTFASGLPTQIAAVGLGGVMDVAFVGNT